MEKYIEVIKQILPLLDTLEEGIHHIQNQLSELRYEEALTILRDVTEGVASIEKAIDPMNGKLSENNIPALSKTVKENLSKAVDNYEKENKINLKNNIEQEILPSFLDWKEEINKTLNPYVIS